MKISSTVSMQSIIGLSLACILFFLPPSLLYALKTAHSQGQDFANKVPLHLDPSSAQSLQGYQGANVKEAQFGNTKAKGEGEKQLLLSDVGKAIVSSQRERQSFKFDTTNDPMFQAADKIVGNPEAVMGATKKTIATKGSTTKATVVCEEAGEPVYLTCTRTLIVTKVRKKYKVYTLSKIKENGVGIGSGHGHNWFHYTSDWRDRKHLPRKWRGRSPLNFSLREDTQQWDQAVVDFTLDTMKAITSFSEDAVKRKARLRSKPPTYIHSNTMQSLYIQKYYTVQGNSEDAGKNLLLDSMLVIETYEKAFDGEDGIPITKKEFNSTTLQEDDVVESWVSDCDALIKRADEGGCTPISKAPSPGSKERVINGQKITRPSWGEDIIFACKVPCKDDCSPWRKKGCTQIDSTCIKRDGERCTVFEQRLSCEATTQGEEVISIDGKGVPWCLDGNCNEVAWAKDGNLAKVMGQMELFKQMQKEMKKLTEGGIAIFRGTDKRCNRDIVGFRDCCGGGDGWGTSLGMASCSEDDKELLELRLNKQCKYIGEYCSEKLLGICVQKKKSYCCYGSKLSRIFQEAAHSQLTLGWGDAENPTCRGLSVEELQGVDFSKVDLSELLEEIMKKITLPDPTKTMKKFTKSLPETNESLKHEQEILLPDYGKMGTEMQHNLNQNAQALEKIEGSK